MTWLHPLVRVKHPIPFCPCPAGAAVNDDMNRYISQYYNGPSSGECGQAQLSPVRAWDESAWGFSCQQTSGQSGVQGPSLWVSGWREPMVTDP